MSEGEANTRISVARLVHKVPSLLKPLETGEINLTTGFLLRNHLSRENCNDLLKAVAGKSTRDVEKVIAARFPQPDAPTIIRKLPSPIAPTVEVAVAVATSPIPPKSSAAERTISMFADAPTSFVDSAPLPSPLASPRPLPSPLPPSPPMKPFHPLSEDRHKIQFTASTALREKIERALRLSSHRNRSGDLAAMVDEAVDLLLATLEKERLGKTTRTKTPTQSRTRAKSPAKSGARSGARSSGATTATAATTSSGRRRFGRDVRREVFKRDGEQCSFVGEDGARCLETRFLEIDHIHAKAKGGASTLENARVLCAAHNRYSAELVFGRDYVERRIHLARQRSPAPTTRIG